MHPLLLSSDVDPFQVAIIVIAVLAGFVKWLWETWQQKTGAAPAPPPDPEEQRLREAAWRKQTGQSSAAPPRPAPVAAPSAWDELRKAWKELQETAKSSQAPAQPRRQLPPAQRQQPQRPPPPLPAQRQQAQRQRQQPARTAAAVEVPTLAAVKAPPVTAEPPAVVLSKPAAPAGSILANLRQLRQDPALMRQAILMQEILGPPKALQSSRDLAI
jgi:FtsZ-interacting cell division protein ZipA